ncbi:hypothetical protein FS837_000463 [Tulasnella sp. UAMH 9824]|nr:hypothetical protein FS837_000463 [Tulasnella sp. UAMH 9824]
MIDTPESIDKDFSSTVELSVNTRRRLEKLTQWRINPDLLEFPEDAPKFEGGYAIVSKALLGPSVDVARDQMMESSCNNLESTDCMAMLESGTGAQEAHGRREEAKGKEAAEKEERESCGETSGQLKVNGNQALCSSVPNH